MRDGSEKNVEGWWWLDKGDDGGERKLEERDVGCGVKRRLSPVVDGRREAEMRERKDAGRDGRREKEENKK